MLFNSNGQSHSIQFMRIVAQINKELVVNASIDLLGQENSVNVNTLSAGAVKDWTVAICNRGGHRITYYFHSKTFLLQDRKMLGL